MRNSEEREQNDTTNDRRNGQRHQRATAGAGADPDGMVLDGETRCLGGGADSQWMRSLFPDREETGLAAVANRGTLAASAQGRRRVYEGL